jgi:Domain of unknown function (DUF4112)
MVDSSNRDRRIEPWIETLEWLMDRSIRVGPWTVGLDPLVGLLPVAGDLVSGVASALIVQHAVRMRIPRSAVARMLLNIYLDTLVGMIPLVGDAFDFAFKANTKNIAILRESLLSQRAAGRDWLFVAGVMLAVAISLALPIVGLVFFLGRLLGA